MISTGMDETIATPIARLRAHPLYRDVSTLSAQRTFMDGTWSACGTSCHWSRACTATSWAGPFSGCRRAILAWQLLESVCDGDAGTWRDARDAAVMALEARLALWDAIATDVAA
jgi:hypothetical protein